MTVANMSRNRIDSIIERADSVTLALARVVRWLLIFNITAWLLVFVGNVILTRWLEATKAVAWAFGFVVVTALIELFAQATWRDRWRT